VTFCDRENLPKRDLSSRTQKPPKRYAPATTGNNIATSGSTNFAFITVTNEPYSYEEAIYSPHSKQWKSAIESEFCQLQKADVFEWVNKLPSGKRAVGSCIVFKEKLDENDQQTKFKARIIAKGFSQVPGQDFMEMFSSVAKFTTLRIFLALATYLDFEIHQVDIIAAYLQGDLDEEIYMEVPKGVKCFGLGSHYWKLKKALYSLKQAGRQ